MIKNLPAMQTWVQFLEKEMATPPIFLPGKSRRQRSLVGYSPWGCKRVRHNLGLCNNIVYKHFYK